MTVNWNRQNFAAEDPEEHPAVLALRKAFSGAVREVESFRGEVWVIIAPEKCRDALRFLKTDPELAFDFLSDVTAVHWPARKEAPFDVVYQIFSIANKMRFRLKIRVSEGQKVDSVCGLWRGADWLEREVFDLFGIPFADHPDLRRILMPSDFEGYPLRKEFPVGGREKW
ncbi:MAG: NADH-quinone oxidoreductase subunit C [Deltaproteobacteria bacterium]|nr:NADH-quinone oxidoreductase subunit C [Deltaproteobacteria bacterium]